MKHRTWVRRRAGRPQLWIALVACGLLWVGLLQIGNAGTLTSVGRPAWLDRAGAPVSLPLKKSELSIGKPHVDCAKVACLVLSFDDGPNPITTPQILDILDQYKVRADFFVVGARAAAMPELLRRMHQAGHEIGNHTWGHPDLTKLTPEEVQAQINKTQEAVIAAGVPAPRLFRPPYGAMSTAVKSQIRLTIALWNIDPEDWHNTDPAKLIQKIIAAAKPGGVIDMHDIDPATVAALPTILQNFQGRFQLVTMSEMFNLSPGQRGEFYGR